MRTDRLRGRQPSPRALRTAFLGALAMNTLIVVSGGAVRLTASGLGCPTFPRCTDDSFVVTLEMGLHGYIEFGNRMLTFAVGVSVLVAVVAAHRARDRSLRVLGLLLLVGIGAQALLGGITVLTGLNPLTVMAHFLLSMVLIAVAVLAYERAARGGDVASQVRRELVLGGYALLTVVATVIVVGTIVTGTGPHSGDKEADDRLPFDLTMVTQLHADLVFLLLGLTIGLLIALRVTDSSGIPLRRAVTLLGVILAQATIGYVQYFTNLPVVLVGVHILGACLVWIAALRFVLALHDARPRRPAGPQTTA